MDWRLFATTFGLIFVAEIGDKTQLATMSLAATGSRWVVFAAAALALVAAAGIAVVAGELLSRFVSPVWLSRAAGALFVVFGVIMLIGSFDKAPPEPGESAPAEPSAPPAP